MSDDSRIFRVAWQFTAMHVWISTEVAAQRLKRHSADNLAGAADPEEWFCFRRSELDKFIGDLLANTVSLYATGGYKRTNAVVQQSEELRQRFAPRPYQGGDDDAS